MRVGLTCEHSVLHSGFSVEISSVNSRHSSRNAMTAPLSLIPPGFGDDVENVAGLLVREIPERHTRFFESSPAQVANDYVL